MYIEQAMEFSQTNMLYKENEKKNTYKRVRKRFITKY